MGLHPKIGITGLPRSGKSAVMEKVLKMLTEERTQEIKLRGNPSGKPIIAGMRTEPIIENGERLGYKVIDIITGDEGVVAHDGRGVGRELAHKDGQQPLGQVGRAEAKLAEGDEGRRR